ncbi:MAG TPA: transcriptional regulator [Metalysinibacillus sp.]
MRQLEKYDLQKLESYWRDLNQLKKELKFREWELLEPYREQDTNIGGGKANTISDTTANKAILLAEDKKYNATKEIISTVEGIYAILDDDRKTIVQMRYWDKNNCYEWEDIADQLHMSRYRVLRLRNTIIDETARRLAWV